MIYLKRKHIKTLFALLIITVLALLLFACKKAVEEQNGADVPDPAHNARNSLDYYGIYYGVLPAADAEGIETYITLNIDDTYHKVTKFLGKKDPNQYEDYGKFSWNKQGSIITLEGLPKPNMYFVGENTLTHLDMDGNKITGNLADKYILRKLVNESEQER